MLKFFRMKLNMKNYYQWIACLLWLCSHVSFAQQFSLISSEVIQLKAMGYDIDDFEKNASIIVGRNGSNKIVLQKNSGRLAISRFFNKKNLMSEKDEYELLKIINQINNDTSIQVSLSKEYLTCAMYIYSPHDIKTFASVVREIEKADRIFDAYPVLLKLLKE